ncbi:gp16 family protein [Salinisphaera hydrothermalis]|uniref:gp16 family protein n=1 Tax=Salinisphaera hydrothermalis TaxID=563188 RepID=UPI00333FD86E
MANDTSRRRAELAKIHIAKKELNLDDGAYRTLLWTVAHVRSSKDLDQRGRRAVLDHLKSRGWKPKAKRAGKRPHNQEREPMLAKIEALLADQSLPWSYADALASHMYSVERVAWLRNPDHLRGVIAALDKRARREEAHDG